MGIFLSYLVLFFSLAGPLTGSLTDNFLHTNEQQYNPEKIFYMSHSKEKEGIASLEKNADKIDILATQFYGNSDKLELVGGLDAQLKKAIAQVQGGQNKIKVMPLVTNANFSQDVVHNFLLSSDAQNVAINSLVNIAKKDNYVGWQFDFENINYLDKDLYSTFVEKSAKSLKENGLILSIAAVSRSVDYEDTDSFKNWGGAFDYARLAKAADFISLMAYDDPNSVGPVASLPFINKVLNYVKDKIPPEKLSFGVPLYYWCWCTDTSKKVETSGAYDGLLYIKSQFPHDLGFDDALGAAWLTYLYQDKQYRVWYQDQQSFGNKLDIVKQNNFRGFSAWVLGVEDPQIWSVLAENKE